VSTESTPYVWTAGPYGMIEKERMDIYHENPALSKSKLDVFIESPLLYQKTYIDKNLLEKEKDEEPRWAVIGDAVHARLLEGEGAFLARFCVEPDFGDCRLKENKARRDVWRAENLGKRALTDFESKQVDAMTVSARSNTGIRELLLRITPEVTWRVNDGEIDFQARCDGFIESADQKLCDILNRESVYPDLIQLGDAIIVDIKTVDSFSGSDFQNWEKAVWSHGYHRAVAFYRGVIRSVKPFPRLHWVFIPLEKKEPFRSGLYVLDEPALLRGWDEIVHHIRRFKACVRENKWPGGARGIQVMSLPGWYLKREIE
jgi:hypothetical protein